MTVRKTETLFVEFCWAEQWRLLASTTADHGARGSGAGGTVLFQNMTLAPRVPKGPVVFTISSYCWMILLALLLLGVVLFLSFTSFPRDSTQLSAAAAVFGINNVTTLVETGQVKLMTLTQEVWVAMAALLILFCLLLVTVMLCGTTPENIARILTVLACLLMVAVSLLFYFRSDLLEKVIVWIKQKGVWGNVLMGLSFLIVSFPLTIGCVVLAMCCGFIYGLVVGSITACLGLLLGGLLAYYGCAKLLKRPVLRHARSSAKLSAILRALRENAWYVSIALRISPVPLGLQNGLLAVTVPMSVYMGSLPFAFPEQILFAYFGKEANQLIDLIAGKQSLHPGQVGLMVFDVVVGLVLFIVCVVFGRRIIAKAMTGQEETLLEESEDSENDQ